MNKRNRSSIRLVGVLGILLALTVMSSASQATLTTDLDGLIARVEARYNGAKTLSVKFRQDYSILGHARPAETGTLTLRKTGRMRWDYARPAGKLFISDGKTVFLYTANNNRVEKVPLKSTEDMRAPLAFLLGKLRFRKEFRDLSLQSDANGYRIAARSATDQLPYERIEMSIAKTGQINNLLVYGRDQSVSRYAFENEQLNPAVDDALFHFETPPGAQVVDALETRNVEGR